MSDLSDAVIATIEGRGKNEPASEAPRPISAKALMDLVFKPPKWAVDGILPEGAALLGGRPKSGKSWLALNIALAVASGGVALGRIKVEKGEVLYLALEDSPRRLQNRLAKLLDKQHTDIPEGLFFVTDWPKADKGGLEAIGQWIEGHPTARLIVIDTLAVFRTGNSLRGDQYGEDYDAMGKIQKLAGKQCIALLGLTHTRKAGRNGVEGDPLDELQGTTGVSAAPDAILVLKRTRLQRTATLFITGRDLVEQSLDLVVDEGFSLWTITTPDLNDPDRGLDSERRAVRVAIREAKRPLSPADLAGILKKHPDAVRQLLHRMARDGYLKKEGYGSYNLPLELPSHLSHCHSEEEEENPFF